MPKRHREKTTENREEKKMKFEAIMKQLKRLEKQIDVSSSSEPSSDAEDKTLPGTDEPKLIQIKAEGHSQPKNIEPANESKRDYEFLGAKPKPQPLKATGEMLHEELVVRWSIYLQDGVQEEIRKEIMEKYPLFENCPLLETPSLEQEIISRLDKKTQEQDKFMSKLQDQTGHALAALGYQMNKLLKDNSDNNNKDVLTTLADVAQLISNVHHALSTHRTSLTEEFLLRNFESELTEDAGLEPKAEPSDEPLPPSVSKFHSVPESRPGPSGYNRLNWQRPQENVKKWWKQPIRERIGNRLHYKTFSRQRH